MAYCLTCGTQLSEDAAYCAGCGSPVIWPPQSAVAEASRPTPAREPHKDVDAGMLPFSEKLAGMLAYVTVVPAIVFLSVQPFRSNRFLRFHAWQSLLTAAGLLAVALALFILSSILHFIPVLGWILMALLWPLCGLAAFALWILLMIKAYQGTIFKLPFIGDLAERQADVSR